MSTATAIFSAPALRSPTYNKPPNEAYAPYLPLQGGGITDCATECKAQRNAVNSAAPRIAQPQSGLLAQREDAGGIVPQHGVDLRRGHAALAQERQKVREHGGITGAAMAAQACPARHVR